MLGLLFLALGMVMNAIALVSAPLTVVQPIGAIALVITTVVNAKDQGLSINVPLWLPSAPVSRVQRCSCCWQSTSRRRIITSIATTN